MFKCETLGRWLQNTRPCTARGACWHVALGAPEGGARPGAICCWPGVCGEACMRAGVREGLVHSLSCAFCQRPGTLICAPAASMHAFVSHACIFTFRMHAFAHFFAHFACMHFACMHCACMHFACMHFLHACIFFACIACVSRVRVLSFFLHARQCLLCSVCTVSYVYVQAKGYTHGPERGHE